jgi:hypothetical protein
MEASCKLLNLLIEKSQLRFNFFTQLVDHHIANKGKEFGAIRVEEEWIGKVLNKYKDLVVEAGDGKIVEIHKLNR